MNACTNLLVCILSDYLEIWTQDFINLQQLNVCYAFSRYLVIPQHLFSKHRGRVFANTAHPYVCVAMWPLVMYSN